MYSLVSSKMLPHHHIRLTADIRADLRVWSIFLQHPLVFNRPFLEFRMLTADDILMYSDASRSPDHGMRAVCMDSWMYTPWDRMFILDNKPSIEFLELYGVTAAVLTWIHRFQNHRICLFCDNMGVVHMINSLSSHCK